ncbi:hypothetical protein BLA29_007470, partial [Euroglyphus maynei]
NHLPTPPAEPQHASYEEQPDLLRQDIVKPVVQDVHETVVPFRRVTQELKPVQESVHQVLARGQERAAGYYGYGGRYGLTSGLLGGAYGSSYALQPATNYGYSTYSTGAYPLRKK